MILKVNPAVIEEISLLHINDDGDDKTDMKNYLLLIVSMSAIAIAIYHSLILLLLRTLFSSHYVRNRPLYKKTSYQVSNMTMNLFLGIYGFYHYVSSVPNIGSVHITERIKGFEEYAIFGALQVGYNIWALPYGLVIGEPLIMIGHHIAALCVGSLSSFSVNGFRYHAPFFFGLIEISSVPLAIMNFCKDNSDLTNARCPNLKSAIRPIFGIIFLCVRVVMWLPKIFDVLWTSGLLLWTCPNHLRRAVISTFWLSAMFLTLLQVFWGSLVLRGMLKSAWSRNRSQKEKYK